MAGSCPSLSLKQKGLPWRGAGATELRCPQAGNASVCLDSLSTGLPSAWEGGWDGGFRSFLGWDWDWQDRVLSVPVASGWLVGEGARGYLGLVEGGRFCVSLLVARSAFLECVGRVGCSVGWVVGVVFLVHEGKTWRTGWVGWVVGGGIDYDVSDVNGCVGGGFPLFAVLLSPLLSLCLSVSFSSSNEWR